MSSLKRILSDFKVFRRSYLRNRLGLFFALVFPVILILIFGTIFSGNSSGTINVYTQNQDTGPFVTPQINIAAQFLHALNTSSTIRVITVDPSENFSQYLSAHSSSDGIIIPANFSADYLQGSPINITVYGNPTSSTSGIVSSAVNGYANYFNLHRFNGTTVIGITAATVNIHQTKYVDFLIPGLVGFTILVSPMFSLVNISSEYKRTKLFKQLSLTPLTKMEWLISKIMLYLLVTLASFLLMVAIGTYVFGANINLTVGIIPFLLIGPHAVRLFRHAHRYSHQNPRNSSYNRQHSNLPNDVPLWHILPHQPHANLPAKLRARAAAVLRSRRLKQRHGLRKHDGSNNRLSSHSRHDRGRLHAGS